MFASLSIAGAKVVVFLISAIAELNFFANKLSLICLVLHNEAVLIKEKRGFFFMNISDDNCLLLSY